MFYVVKYNLGEFNVIIGGVENYFFIFGNMVCFVFVFVF